MPRTRLLAAFLLAGTLLAPVLPPVPGAAPLPEPDDLYFPTKVGATARYESRDGVGTFTVTAVRRSGRTRIVTVECEEAHRKSRDTGTMTLKVSPDGVYLLNLTVVERAGSLEVPSQLSWPSVWLKLPHKPGQTWEAEENAVHRVGTIRSSTGSKTVRVRDREVVTVPGGTYTAIPVEKTGRMNSMPSRSTVWYARGVGPVKSVSEWTYEMGGRTQPARHESVLVSFAPGKD